MAKWHLSGVEKVRYGILIEAETAGAALKLAEETDLQDWSDGGEYEFVIDHVTPWQEI
jgi:hypothetical protein